MIHIGNTQYTKVEKIDLKGLTEIDDRDRKFFIGGGDEVFVEMIDRDGNSFNYRVKGGEEREILNKYNQMIAI